MKYNIEQYKVPDGKLLIKPFKYRSRTVTNIVLDDEKNKDKDPLKDEMETKVEKVKAPYEIQLAEVLSSGDNRYPMGSVIVYSIKFVREFDLFKNTFLISNHDVHGVYTMD